MGLCLHCLISARPSFPRKVAYPIPSVYGLMIEIPCCDTQRGSCCIEQKSCAPLFRTEQGSQRQIDSIPDSVASLGSPNVSEKILPRKVPPVKAFPSTSALPSAPACPQSPESAALYPKPWRRISLPPSLAAKGNVQRRARNEGSRWRQMRRGRISSICSFSYALCPTGARWGICPI